MLSPEQLAFFQAFADFHPRPDADAHVEFGRLASQRNWTEGGRIYRRHLRALDALATSGRRNEVDELASNLGSIALTSTAGGITLPPQDDVRSRYARLAESNNWEAGSSAYAEGLTEYLAREVAALYGTNTLTLEVLTDLCNDIQIVPVPASKTKCKRAIEKVNVNIFDFLECKRLGSRINPLHPSLSALRRYTERNDKVCPLKRAKKSQILRLLLKHFHY